MLSAVCDMHCRNCCVSNVHVGPAGIIGAVPAGPGASTAAGAELPHELETALPIIEPAIDPAIDEPNVPIMLGP